MNEEAQASGAAAPRKPAALAPGLHIVATPIGNMGDITLRAVDVLRAADVIACEDTRVFAKLATHHGISVPTVAYSDATQDSAGPRLMRALAEGKRVALVSDAGMPLISEYARRFGVYDNLPSYLSYSLGAGETTVMRTVTAYSMFDNGGKRIIPTFIDRIQDRYGRTVYKHDQRECRGWVAITSSGMLSSGAG